ncbi:MAG: hypothetical protein CVV25_14820 [Ignavibacteriae bacterium HGW-Ignavibacteriae-4]|jgi:predicted transcriptional regulator|nr:MAG: hypothetical protein CVV34_03485 [Methanomicrobiales archaeon HGW-Methanomicrobiales-5]PKL77248.1 MAG: hypothetical protein CVV25_14820 [Ignavibacteriae bacterium HGW-Ignavibacteriae-4]
MRVLLSIKPEFADLIFSGKKKYEYRKQIFKKDVKTVVVYASAPVQKVIGEFTIDCVHHEDINDLWQKTESGSGISRHYFNEYFLSHERGYAIKVLNINKYVEPLNLNELYQSPPPQSFAYIN